jgi:hypothetical protein
MTTATTETLRPNPTPDDGPTHWVSGHKAIEFAECHGLELSKYADPTEGARDGLTLDEARRVAAEDPSLVYCNIPH